MRTNTLESLPTTPAIPVGNIKSQQYLGIAEIDGQETHIVMITTPEGQFLVSGGACNAGLLPEYARAYDPDAESLGESLQEFLSDLEAGEYPSGELLRWHGSLVI